jgi:hypothetical protein
MANLTLAQMLALLPDNTTGLIDAVNVRDVVQALFERTDGTNPIPALQFDTTATQVVQVAGHVHWNPTENTLEADIGPDGSLQIGYEQWLNGRNTTGSTIFNGTPVRITTGGGQNIFIAPDTGVGLIVGVATEDIPNNSTGRVTTFGTLHDLNTAAFNDGDQLFSSAAGALSTSPSSSFVGVVTAAHASSGTIQASPDRRVVGNGTTAQRPTARVVGFTYFDSTLGIPVFWNGAAWVNASGAVV